MRNIPFALSIVLLGLQTAVSGQSLQRQSIVSAGSAATVDGIRFSQTIGQCYSTLGYHDASLSLHPGFQQAAVFIIQDARTALDVRLSLFPNPATNACTIQSSETLEQATLLVVDMQGRVVLQEHIEVLDSMSFDCSDWNSGIYAVSVSDPFHRSTTAKLILEK